VEELTLHQQTKKPLKMQNQGKSLPRKSRGYPQQAQKSRRPQKSLQNKKNFS